jgi:uncharacterized protein YidB (DUF937 family)
MSEFLGQAWIGLTQILGMAQGAAGGALTGLLEQLENTGLGEHVASWVGPGDNLPVTAEQLQDAFTPQQLQVWAEHDGITPRELLERLAQTLPHAVDQATPEGKLPAD